LLGTLVEVRASGRPTPELQAAVDAAFAAVERIHRLMSFHETSSDVSRLNRDAAAQPVRVDAWTRRVLRRSVRLHAETGGIFDIAIAPGLVRGGWLPGAVTRRAQRGTAADILLRRDGRVRFRRPLLIDLGGIAKGFAVDCAIAVLRRHEVRSAVVNAGGDLRVLGPRPEPIHVRLPESPGRLCPLFALHDGAVATSAHYYAERLVDGRRRSPIFDPHRRQLRGDRLSVTVQARECWLADALCKVVWLAGARALPLLQRHGARAWVLDAGVVGRQKERRHAA
jgi:thiamine biosynthesis lipoprotein